MKTILSAVIIDDEEDMCTLLSGYLRKQKVAVQVAYDLKSGKKSISDSKPDFLFLDNNLPDGSGVDCITEIRQLHPNMRIIVISAMTNLKESALENSADDFLGKPISFTTIKAIIEAASG